VYKDYLPKLFDYACHHPEVLEPCDVFQMIEQHDFSYQPSYNQIYHLFWLYDPFFFPQNEDLRIPAISYYEDNDSLELVARPNPFLTAETQIFFLNLVESCLIYDQQTLLDFLVKSGMVSRDGTVTSHQADSTSGWRSNLARKLKILFARMVHAQEDSQTVAKKQKKRKKKTR
jgi:hypothetical protein